MKTMPIAGKTFYDRWKQQVEERQKKQKQKEERAKDSGSMLALGLLVWWMWPRK